MAYCLPPAAKPGKKDQKELFLDQRELFLDQKELFLDQRELFLDQKELFLDQKELFLDRRELLVTHSIPGFVPLHERNIYIFYATPICPTGPQPRMPSWFQELAYEGEDFSLTAGVVFRFRDGRGPIS